MHLILVWLSYKVGPWAGTIIIHFGKTNPKYWRYFKALMIQTFRIFVAPSNFSALPIKPYFVWKSALS